MLSVLINFLSNAFHGLDYSAEKEAAAMRYARDRHGMLFGYPSARDLPSIQKVRSDEALSLHIYRPTMDSPVAKKAAGWMWTVTVVDTRDGVVDEAYEVYGNSPEQAQARAAQLVSALDGARRL